MDAITKEAVCSHCKSSVNPKATKCPHCGGKIFRWTRNNIAGAILLGLLVLWIVNISSDVSKPAPGKTPEQVAADAQELAAWQQTPAGRLCAKHADWDRPDCELAINKRVNIGMPVDMLVYYYGPADHVNTSNYGQGERKQYCWNGYTPSCFYDDDGDGRVDSYN